MFPISECPNPKLQLRMGEKGRRTRLWSGIVRIIVGRSGALRWRPGTIQDLFEADGKCGLSSHGLSSQFLSCQQEDSSGSAIYQNR